MAHGYMDLHQRALIEINDMHPQVVLDTVEVVLALNEKGFGDSSGTEEMKKGKSFPDTSG